MGIFPKYDILGKAMLAQSIFPVMAWLKNKKQKTQILIESLQITILLWKVGIHNNSFWIQETGDGEVSEKNISFKNVLFQFTE